MFRILDIDHLVLRVADLERMLHFYGDVLGCSVERRQDAIGLVQLRAGRSLIDLVPVSGALGRAGGAAPGPQGRNLDHFCLRIEPFDEAAIRARLAEYGLAAGAVEQRFGAEGRGPSIYLTDPEGNVVELKGPALGSGTLPQRSTRESMPLDYRPATADDVPRCIALRGITRQNAISAERLASYGITAASWGDAVRQGRQAGFVGLQRGEIIGYCFSDTATGEVLVLALLPAHEGQGVGRELLGRVVEQLVALGHRRLFLGCSADPASRSYGFYRHLGWRSTGRFDAHDDEVLEFAAGDVHS